MEIKLKKTFLAFVRTLTSDMDNHEVVETAMKRMMTKTMKKLEATCVKGSLQILYERDMGTADVVNLTTRLCRNNKSK